MRTDIEIAQAAKMLPISQVAARAGIGEELLEHYGRYKAKLDLTSLRDKPRKGKLILVTAINPTPAGGAFHRNRQNIPFFGETS